MALRVIPFLIVVLFSQIVRAQVGPVVEKDADCVPIQYVVNCPGCQESICFDALVCYKVQEVAPPSGKMYKFQIKAWVKNGLGTITVNGKAGAVTYDIKGNLIAQFKDQLNNDKTTFKLHFNLLATVTDQGAPEGTPTKIHLIANFNIDVDCYYEIKAVFCDLEDYVCDTVYPGSGNKAAQEVEVPTTAVVTQCESSSGIAPWAMALVGAACATMAIIGLALGGALWFVCSKRHQRKELIYEEVDSKYAGSSGILAPTTTPAMHQA